MIHIDDATQVYLRKLIAQQDLPELGIRLRATQPGTAKADCKLEFCEIDEVTGADFIVECAGFKVYVDQISAPFLEGTELSYQSEQTGGQLTIKAPKLKARVPDGSSSVIERVQYVIDNEINPGVASHGGKVSLVELGADGTVVLRFGGGCQGCGMVSVTLKQGVEKTLMQRVPEVTAVRDVTDHASGSDPYYVKDQGQSALA